VSKAHRVFRELLEPRVPLVLRGRWAPRVLQELKEHKVFKVP
jgi:hypothetical protein